MSDLKSQLIKLAYENPEIRKDLLPLVQKEAASKVKGDIQKAFKQLNKKYGDAIKKQVENLEFEAGDTGQTIGHQVLSSALSIGWDEPTVEYLLEVKATGSVYGGIDDLGIIKIVQKVLGVSPSALDVQDGVGNSRYGLTVRATIYPDLGTI